MIQQRKYKPQKKTTHRKSPENNETAKKTNL